MTPSNWELSKLCPTNPNKKLVDQDNTTNNNAPSNMCEAFKLPSPTILGKEIGKNAVFHDNNYLLPNDWLVK